MTKTLNMIKKKVDKKIRTDGMVRNFLHLGDVLLEKDSYTFEHCKNVAYYCSLIGSRTGISTKKMESLIIGALFHDLGKITIPKEILNKPGALSGSERRIVQTHPKASAKMLQTAGCSGDAVSATLLHHERYDGTGYPYGLKGDEIPSLAKIISVADAYDAMMTDRYYSDALEQEEAIQSLHFHKGTQFDPYIVDIFTDTLQYHRTDLRAV